MDSKLKQNELRLQVENLYSQINQKDQDRRNMIKKEYGYDDALISLQNDISSLETKFVPFFLPFIEVLIISYFIYFFFNKGFCP